jgi:hypothetical protein
VVAGAAPGLVVGAAVEIVFAGAAVALFCFAVFSMLRTLAVLADRFGPQFLWRPPDVSSLDLRSWRPASRSSR